jgi:hypothetical protein
MPERVWVDLAIGEHDTSATQSQRRPTAQPHTLVDARALTVMSYLALLIEVYEDEVRIGARKQRSLPRVEPETLCGPVRVERDEARKR